VKRLGSLEGKKRYRGGGEEKLLSDEFFLCASLS
jgi:hypothetical protein